MNASKFREVFGPDRDYWGEDPYYSLEDWIEDVHEGGTRLGYRDWVIDQREDERDEI